MADERSSYEQAMDWLDESVQALAYEELTAHEVREALTVIRIIVEQEYLPHHLVLSEMKKHGLEEFAQKLSWLRG